MPNDQIQLFLFPSFFCTYPLTDEEFRSLSSAVLGKISITFWYLLIFSLYCTILLFIYAILFSLFSISFLRFLFLFAFETMLSCIVCSICSRCFLSSSSYAFFIESFIIRFELVDFEFVSSAMLTPSHYFLRLFNCYVKSSTFLVY